MLNPVAQVQSPGLALSEAASASCSLTSVRTSNTNILHTQFFFKGPHIAEKTEQLSYFYEATVTLVTTDRQKCGDFVGQGAGEMRVDLLSDTPELQQASS